jgi:hypothetical protein
VLDLLGPFSTRTFATGPSRNDRALPRGCCPGDTGREDGLDCLTQVAQAWGSRTKANRCWASRGCTRSGLLSRIAATTSTGHLAQYGHAGFSSQEQEVLAALIRTPTRLCPQRVSPSRIWKSPLASLRAAKACGTASPQSPPGPYQAQVSGDRTIKPVCPRLPRASPADTRRPQGGGGPPALGQAQAKGLLARGEA